MNVYFRAHCTVGNDGLRGSESSLGILPVLTSCPDKHDKQFRTQHRFTLTQDIKGMIKRRRIPVALKGLAGDPHPLGHNNRGARWRRPPSPSPRTAAHALRPDRSPPRGVKALSVLDEITETHLRKRWSTNNRPSLPGRQSSLPGSYTPATESFGRTPPATGASSWQSSRYTLGGLGTPPQGRSAPGTVRRSPCSRWSEAPAGGLPWHAPRIDPKRPAGSLEGVLRRLATYRRVLASQGVLRAAIKAKSSSRGGAGAKTLVERAGICTYAMRASDLMRKTTFEQASAALRTAPLALSFAPFLLLSHSSSLDQDFLLSF